MTIGLLGAMVLMAQTGEIKGRIRVTSTLTKRRISVPQVYERNVAIPAPAVSRPDAAAELSRVVVYIDATNLPTHPIHVVMDQHNRQFDPEVVAVPVGSTVSFPNSDPIFHNIFSLSKAKPLDLGNYKAGETRSVTFSKPGAVQLHCHLHPNMSGAVFITPNRWFTQPSPTGDFTLTEVPPGNYTLMAWHKSAGFFRRSIHVIAGQPVQMDFEIPLTEQAGTQ